MGRECGACVSHTLGLGPPRANFIWQLSLPVASTVAMRNVCLTSIHAFRSLATNVRSGQAEERAGLFPVDRESPSRCLFVPQMHAGLDSRQQRLGLCDLGHLRCRRKAF